MVSLIEQIHYLLPKFGFNRLAGIEGTHSSGTPFHSSLNYPRINCGSKIHPQGSFKISLCVVSCPVEKLDDLYCIDSVIYSLSLPTCCHILICEKFNYESPKTCVFFFVKFDIFMYLLVFNFFRMQTIIYGFCHYHVTLLCFLTLFTFQYSWLYEGKVGS